MFLGVDAGGTKTHALVADSRGTVLGIGRAGPGNWETVGLDGALKAVRQAVTAALTGAGAVPRDLTALAFGLSGLDWRSDESPLRTLVVWLDVSCPQIVVNDSFVALSAGTSNTQGVVVAAGTGVTCAGRNKNRQTARTLGLRYPFDDWGGAPDLARAAVHCVARAYTGRGPATSLSDRLVGLAESSDVAGFLESVSRQRYDLDRWAWELTRILFQESTAGDAVAREVVERAGRELGDGAATVISRLGMGGEKLDLVLAGGVFRQSSALLLKTLTQTVWTVAPAARIVRLQAPVVVGSVFLAMEASGHQVTKDIRRSLQQGATTRFSDRDADSGLDSTTAADGLEEHHAQ